MRVVTSTLLLGFFLLIWFPFKSESLECINSTSYMDRVLVKPRSSECRLKTALCVKTMQISQNTDGSPKVLSIHRECFELEPPQAYREGKGCVDSYDDDDPISRRLGGATPDHVLLFTGSMQLLNLFSILFPILGYGTKCLSLRILVYSPRMIPSHVSFVANIANLLSNRGHKVVVIDSMLRNDISNKIDLNAVEKVFEVETAENVPELLKHLNIPVKFWKMKNEPDEQKEVMENLGEVFLEQCKHSMMKKELFAQLAEIEFDFGIHEVFDVCGIGIFEKLGIRKSVILSSTGMRDIVNEALGLSGPLQDSSILSDYGRSIPFFGIRRNLKFHSAWRNFFEVQSKFLEHSLGFNKIFESLLRYSNLMFVNTHELADCQRAWSRRVHEIGGISFKTPNILEEEYTEQFKKYASVILVSFGTTTPSSLMPNDYKTTLLHVFKRFPKTLVIWKYEKEDDFVEENSGINIIFKKYIPQIDLLESGRISLFITHGGQNSLLEAFHSNTRTLIIPLFGDQHRNGQMALENGLSHVLKKEDLANQELVEETIKQSLQSEKNLDIGLQRISMNLRNAKQRSETVLISTIESTYTENPSPPNFENHPKFYSSDDILFMIDSSFLFFVSLLIFILMRILFL